MTVLRTLVLGAPICCDLEVDTRRVNTHVYSSWLAEGKNRRRRKRRRKSRRKRRRKAYEEEGAVDTTHERERRKGKIKDTDAGKQNKRTQTQAEQWTQTRRGMRTCSSMCTDKAMEPTPNVDAARVRGRWVQAVLMDDAAVAVMAVTVMMQKGLMRGPALPRADNTRARPLQVQPPRKVDHQRGVV